MASKRPAFHPPIRLTDTEGVYRVGSQSVPGDYYTVDVRRTAHPTCDCPAGLDTFRCCKRDAVCKHVRAAEEFRAELALLVARAERIARQAAITPALQPALI